MMRIAVIEDDSRYRRSLEMLFSGAPGFALAGSYSSAESAIADLRRATAAGRRPGWDLVLLDLDLPGVKGTKRMAGDPGSQRAVRAVRALPVMRSATNEYRVLVAGRITRKVPSIYS